MVLRIHCFLKIKLLLKTIEMIGMKVSMEDLRGVVGQQGNSSQDGGLGHFSF